MKEFRALKREYHAGVPQGGDMLAAIRIRIVVLSVIFLMAFSVVCGRLGYLMVGAGLDDPSNEEATTAQGNTGRADIVDRNGIVLATSLVTQSLYANPRMVLNPKETAGKLSKLFPDLKYEQVLAKLTSEKGFIWLKRNLTPKQQNAVYELGLPGIEFQREEKRVYPHGRLFAHVLGCTDVDSRGVAGAERFFNEALMNDLDPLQLSLDARVQHVLKDEIQRKIEEFNAIGGSGVVMDVNTGEVVALVSLPDYDPHVINQAKKEELFNAATLGVYEVGSSMKILTTALALESGVVNTNSRYDISTPIRVGRFRIKDYHPKKMVADIPQIFLFSSNIGMVKMVQDLGVKRHKEFLARFGLLEPAMLELPEVGAPLIPADWREVSSMTISYGYGISISPIQLVNAVSSVVNGGILRRPTLLKYTGSQAPAGVRVVSEKTSQTMRELLRLVVQLGTGRKANVPGFDVGGKTGTAEKASRGGYSRENMVSFLSAFPMHNPKYVVMVMVDTPKGNKSSYGFATAGWIAAPAVKNIIARIAPILGVQPRLEEGDASEMVTLYKASMKGH